MRAQGSPAGSHTPTTEEEQKQAARRDAIASGIVALVMGIVLLIVAICAPSPPRPEPASSATSVETQGGTPQDVNRDLAETSATVGTQSSAQPSQGTAASQSQAGTWSQQYWPNGLPKSQYYSDGSPRYAAPTATRVAVQPVPIYQSPGPLDLPGPAAPVGSDGYPLGAPAGYASSSTSTSYAPSVSSVGTGQAASTGSYSPPSYGSGSSSSSSQSTTWNSSSPAGTLTVQPSTRREDPLVASVEAQRRAAERDNQALRDSERRMAEQRAQREREQETQRQRWAEQDARLHAHDADARTCKQCNGTGRCSVCYGSGHVFDKSCVRCKGTGTCQWCQGKGKI